MPVIFAVVLCEFDGETIITMITGDLAGFEAEIEGCIELGETRKGPETSGPEFADSLRVFEIVGDAVTKTLFELLISGMADCVDNEEDNALMLDGVI